MLTVWTGIWGDKYPEHYLPKLRHAVRRNLTIPHRFRVLADKPRRGYFTKRPDLGWASWWPKLALFALDRPGDTNLWIDLDSVIVGSLDRMVLEHCNDRLAMPANWAQSGHGGCQSSVMIWQSGACFELFNSFDYSRDSGRYWGDQEWITASWGDPRPVRLPAEARAVRAIAHPFVCSYKYHCSAGPPPGAAVVTFHGFPKPGDVADEWVRKCWR